MRQLYYKLQQLFYITNCSKILLQNELLQNAPVLLQNAAVITKRADFITKRGRYYKTRRLLQNGTVHMVQSTIWNIFSEFRFFV